MDWEGENKVSEHPSPDWNEWAEIVDGKLYDLHWRLEKSGDSHISVDFLLEQFRKFEETFGAKVSKGHEEFLGGLNQKVQGLDAHIISKVDQEKQKNPK